MFTASMAVEDGDGKPPAGDAPRTLALPSWVVAAAAGEVHAQSRFFREHRDRVASQLLRMTGDPTIVDDLLQEVFLSAFSGLGSFRGDATLETWLYRIALNKARNWWDSRLRRQRREVAGGARLNREVSLPDEDLEVVAHRERLYAALETLPEKLREAFVCRAVEGMSLIDASAALGVPISTVSYRTRRAELLLCRALGIEEPT
jgi:RNA polymerase sigma-70 factor (ECF subfamily)